MTHQEPRETGRAAGAPGNRRSGADGNLLARSGNTRPTSDGTAGRDTAASRPEDSTGHPDARPPGASDARTDDAGRHGAPDAHTDAGRPGAPEARTDAGRPGAPDARTDIDDGVPYVTYRAVTMVVAGAGLALLLLAMMLIPLPYAVQRPGPTVDTLSEHEGEPLIAVDGAPTYPTGGELRLTTVSVSGGPGYPVTAVDVLAGWIDDNEVVLPREAVFPEGTTREQIDEESSAQMASSQTSATVAALEELGQEVPMVLTVTGVAPGSGAEGALEPGDVITSIRPAGESRTEVQSFSDLSQVLGSTAPGTVVTVGIERDGSSREVDVTTMGHPGTQAGEAADEPQGSLLGVVLEPDVELPVDISFDIDNIGGPSAGTMFALGIVDLLTPGEMTGGERIAGTGTMDLAGDVGAIGGIQQKLAGAKRDGAEWFLAPEDNCGEVVGHVPAGLRVVSVGTLGEARDAVEAIGSGDTADLPTCVGASDA
ncbi:YlbL family protein [Georgenia subflava]|uniref:YlbL family protein n=1 Tax=Georgenia subflava TaxID=1622177 RepID=UPI001D033B17|nr:S16 family serine protease [Georgenia subflava]